ncbi:MAG: GTP cyclohydrolase FolE2 [Spirochaetaceae bacterium]|jgi:GTP cyclohydrolase I|nr:GTP cyclohydrolase FolE2 [Spirochaetaceae bacterium]
MIDVQSQEDTRDIPLTKVGVKGLEYPIRVLDKLHKVQHTTGRADLYADLPRHFKGTHMSRFVEIFHRHSEDLSMPRFLDMLEEIAAGLEAESAWGRVEFPYFLEKQAPVSRIPGMMSYRCRYEGRVRHNAAGVNTQGGNAAVRAGKLDRHFVVAVSVPVSTVCPCSRAISDRGAHNQRGIVTVELELGPFFWIEDIIDLVEKAASSPVYSILKREDEKAVTEAAYDNPKFVEDLVRDIYTEIKKLGSFPRFTVEAENFESIHNHSAYARAVYDTVVSNLPL